MFQKLRKIKGEIKFKIKELRARPAEICFKIILIGILLILCTPLVVDGKYFYPHLVPKTLYFIGLTQIIFITWLILNIFSKDFRPRLNSLFLFIILFIGALILGSIFGVDFWRSFWGEHQRMDGLFVYFHLFLFFVVISSFLKKEQDWLVIFGISVSVAVLISLLSLLALVDVNLPSILLPPHGGVTLGNSSFLGTYLLFNIFLVFYLFLNSQKAFSSTSRAPAKGGEESLLSSTSRAPAKGGEESLLSSTKDLKIYSVISFLIIFSALLLSGARAAIISFFGGVILLFLFWLIFCQKGNLKIIGISFLIIFFILISSLIYLAFQPGTFVFETITRMASRSRFLTWQISWQGFLERPWFGWGLENVEIMYNQNFSAKSFLPEYGGEILHDETLNIIFDTLIAGGIFGLIFYLVILGTVFYLLWKKFSQKEIDFSIFGVFSALLISHFALSLTLSNMISDSLMFFLVLGFIGSLARNDFQKKEYFIPLPNKAIFSAKIIFLIVILLVLFCFSFLKFVIQPFRASFLVIQAINNPVPQERIILYQRALETSPLGKHLKRDFFARTSMNFIKEGIDGGASKKDLKLELNFISQELRKSIKESPLDFNFYLRLGQVYNLYGLIDPSKSYQAENILKKGLQISPNHQQAYWELANAYFFQKQFDKSLFLLEKAIKLESKVFVSHLRAIRFAQKIGDYELAEKKIQEAIKINHIWEQELRNNME